MLIKFDLIKLAENIFLLFLSIEFLLFSFHWCFVYSSIEIPAFYQPFNITREDGIGNWFSSIQALLVGLVLLMIYLCKKVQAQRSSQVLPWAVLAGFFIFISFDDGTVFHERIGDIFDELASRGHIPTFFHELLNLFPSYTWLLVVLPFFALMGLFLLSFLWRELQGSGLKYLLLCALGCYVLAVLLDGIEGINSNKIMLQSMFNASEHTITHLLMSIEEFIEMFGTTLFLVIFIRHLNTVVANRSICFQ